MIDLCEEKDGKFYIRGKELPSHIDGKKVLGVTTVKRDGVINPIIDLEDTDNPPITTIENKPTIKVRFINKCIGGKELKQCILSRYWFIKDEWHIVDKDTYLNEVMSVADNEFEIDINGEIIVINKTHKHYIINKLNQNGGE